MLKRDEAVLIVIDVQGKLHEAMSDKDQMDCQIEKVIRCAQRLEIPVGVTEQLPEKLGHTSEPFGSLLKGEPVFEKSAFSCCGDSAFKAWWTQQARPQAILVGIETHVCVYQTAMDLLEQGVEVVVVGDAVSSRAPENRTLALEAIRQAGGQILPTETVLFALLRDAADPAFRDLLKLIR